MATKLEGVGGKALVARPLKKLLFYCGFPNSLQQFDNVWPGRLGGRGGRRRGEGEE